VLSSAAVRHAVQSTGKSCVQAPRLPRCSGDPAELQQLLAAALHDELVPMAGSKRAVQPGMHVFLMLTKHR
jgi:hypothetical protein